MTKDWKEIHPDFTPELQKQWESKEFTCEETQEWINFGLQINEADFASHLREQGYITPELCLADNVSIEELRKEYDNENHLSEEISDGGENGNDIASERDNDHLQFNYQLQKDWRVLGLSSSEVNEWIKAGLKPEDAELAKWLKEKTYIPQWISNHSDIETLRNEFKKYRNKKNIEYVNIVVNAQNWINNKYPNKQQIKIIETEYLDNFQGSLTISDYLQLEKIHIQHQNNLTNLQISNCPNLKELIVGQSQLINLDLSNNLNLERLDLWANNFNQDLSFVSHLINLKELYLGNSYLVYLGNNRFAGSLEPLNNLTKLEYLDINNTDIENGLEYLPDSLKIFNCSADKRKDAKVKTIYNLFSGEKGKIETENSYIKNFPQKLQNYKQWIKLSFSEKEVKEWVNAGAALDDYEFVSWLRDVKGYGLGWILNYKEDYQILSERFKNYGLCSECNQPNTGEKWCNSCNKSHLFARPVSSIPQINEFILKYQLEATDADKFIEWIPYQQFSKIEFLAEGGFGKVYKAKWNEGNISHWDAKNKQWHREKDASKNHREVVLKSLNNSSENTEFLSETEKHKIIDDWFNNIVPCYGLSQDSKGNYLMVMKYMPEGNLRHYLNENNKKLREKLAQEKKLKQEIEALKDQSQDEKTLETKQQELTKVHSEVVELQNKLSIRGKLSHLLKIAQGLKDIHSKNLVHRDFHSGNILKGIEQTSCLITDLGLCKPVNTKNEEEIYGVIPYVAPEILLSKPYNLASDIYSFGIITYEVFSGLPPYYEVEHDIDLILEICDGIRPEFKIKIPQLLEDLIKKCWDANPTKRPTASQLERILRGWEQGDTEFAKQLQEAENYNQTLPDSIKYPDYQKKTHTRAVYTSRLLPTKEISEIISHGSKKISEKIRNSLIDLNSFYDSLYRENDMKKNSTESDNNYHTKELGFDIKIKKPNQENNYHSRDLGFDIELENLTERTKRQLSLETQTKTNQGEPKSIKIDEQSEYNSEPMEIEISTRNWQNIHLEFTPELVQNWQNLNFTYNQTQEWINVGFSPQDYDLVNFVQNNLDYDAETILNNANIGLEVLRNAHQRHLQQNSEQTAQTVQPISWPNN